MFDIKPYILDIPNYPEEGVVFKDITPLLAHPEAFRAAITQIAEHFADKGITKVIGAEARGFIIGTPVAYEMKAGFIPARKPGKLPRKTLSVEYALEYGTDRLEIHDDALSCDDVVLIVDDVLATGGTACAQIEMVKQAGAKLAGFAFILELDFLKGRDKITQEGEYDILSLMNVE